MSSERSSRFQAQIYSQDNADPDSNGEFAISKSVVRLESGVARYSSQLEKIDADLDNCDDAQPTMLNDVSMFDLKVKETVGDTLKKILKSTIGLNFLLPLLFCLFFGVGWSPKDNFKNIRVAVADFDGGIVGKTLMTVSASPTIPITITQAILNFSSSRWHVLFNFAVEKIPF